METDPDLNSTRTYYLGIDKGTPTDAKCCAYTYEVQDNYGCNFQVHLQAMAAPTRYTVT